MTSSSFQFSFQALCSTIKLLRILGFHPLVHLKMGAKMPLESHSKGRLIYERPWVQRTHGKTPKTSNHGCRVFICRLANQCIQLQLAEGAAEKAFSPIYIVIISLISINVNKQYAARRTGGQPEALRGLPRSRGGAAMLRPAQPRRRPRWRGPWESRLPRIPS